MIGDLVEIGSQYGRVVDLTMRSTRVVTPDGRMLAAPDNAIVNITVASYTNSPHLRLDIPFAVGMGEHIDKARGIAPGLCREDERFMPQPPPEAVPTGLNDYNLAMELRVRPRDEKTRIAPRHSLREVLCETLRKAGVDMPFETPALAPLEVRGLPMGPGRAENAA